MTKFTIKPLEGTQIIEIADDRWNLFHYDASDGIFCGRIEAFLQEGNSAWHYYEIEPGHNDRARVFYGAIKTKMAASHTDKKLLKELRVVAEKCHSWLSKQTNKKWKRLAAPISQGVIIEKVAHTG